MCRWCKKGVQGGEWVVMRCKSKGSWRGACVDGPRNPLLATFLQMAWLARSPRSRSHLGTNYEGETTGGCGRERKELLSTYCICPSPGVLARPLLEAVENNAG